MIPLSQNIYLWRRYRGLSQDQLAVLAGLSRPNLSNIEKGKRDLTVETLRRIAHSLHITGGTLIDGIPPQSEKFPSSFDRARLERIADHVVLEIPLKNPAEQFVADLLKPLVESLKRSYEGRKGIQSRQTRVRKEAWFLLKSHLEPSVLSSLLQRIDKKAYTHGPKTD